METNQNPPINRDLIKSTGENLIWIGILIFGNILISGFIYSSISDSRDIEEIKNLYQIWGYISLILIFVKGLLFIYSGKNLIDSLKQPNENYGELNTIPFVSAIDLNPGGIYFNPEGIYFETEYFPNGKIKIKKSFNKEGMKHGFWEHYFENGELDYREVYRDDTWIKHNVQ